MDDWIDPQTEDYRPEVLALGESYGRYQAEVTAIKARVREEFKEAIAQRTAELTRHAEQEFAGQIRDAVEAGMPQSWIRKAVLRTSDWGRWTKWRDLAGLKPERKFWYHEED